MEQALASTAPHIPRERGDVFGLSRGLSRRAWEAVRFGYERAGRGGIVAALYRWARRNPDYDRRSPALRVLGRDLRPWARGAPLVVVDHPAVVGALGGGSHLWYMHGEMAAPPDAIVRSAARILVPLDETADAFVHGGADRTRLLVTGVCIEEGLRFDAGETTAARRSRLGGAAPLSVAFFSSGAEPPAHVRTLAVGACALAHHGNHDAVVFAKRGGSLEAAVRDEATRTGASPRMILFESRRDVNECTAREFARLDVVVSPPHERSNWAVALGVPFLLVGPDLGPFAPRNRALLEARGVASEIASSTEAVSLPARLERMRREGILAQMSTRGTGPSVRGFEVAAQFVTEEWERRGECRST